MWGSVKCIGRDMNEEALISMWGEDEKMCGGDEDVE